MERKEVWKFLEYVEENFLRQLVRWSTCINWICYLWTEKDFWMMRLPKAILGKGIMKF